MRADTLRVGPHIGPHIGRKQLPLQELLGNAHVAELDLSSSCIGPLDAVVISLLLGVNASLTSVLTPTLEPSPYHKHVTMAYEPPLTDFPHSICFPCSQLDVSRNLLGPEGAKPLADALRVNTELTKIK